VYVGEVSIRGFVLELHLSSSSTRG